MNIANTVNKTNKKSIGIGVIGMGWMGEAHSNGYAQLQRLPINDYRPELIICNDILAEKAEASRQQFGFRECTTDWREVVNHPNVDVVDITAPNGQHLEIIAACVAAGKHINCEKPIGATPAETLKAYALVKDAPIQTSVGYNYRWAPMVQHTKKLIEDGTIGEVLHYNGRFFSCYAANPMGGHSWRYRKENGFGALTDILSHATDMALYLGGEVDLNSVQGRLVTLIKERPVLPEGAGHYNLGNADSPMAEVTNDDYAGAQLRFKNGAIGFIDSSRAFYGPTSENRFEIHGSKGSIRWNFETMNELQLLQVDNEHPENQGYRTIYSAPHHQGHHLFNPSDGSGLGYNDLKALEVYYFLNRLVKGEDKARTVTFEDAAKVAEVLQALIDSSST